MAVPSPSTMQNNQSSNEPNLDPNSEEYVRLKERVLLLERIILHTIGFELSIEHPYKYLVDCVQEKKRMLEYAKPPTTTTSMATSSASQSKSAQYAQMVQELAQNAMNFANDSMHTSLCLQYTAREIAMTCVYLSGKYSGIRPVGNRPWIELLDGITVEDLTSISIQILELVQPRKGMESEMAFKMIRKDLDEMCKSGEMPDSKRIKTN
jgi:cyclin T